MYLLRHKVDLDEFKDSLSSDFLSYGIKSGLSNIKLSNSTLTLPGAEKKYKNYRSTLIVYILVQTNL